MSNNPRPTLEEIVALCKRRGFVFPTSEIYGGLTSSYDYGPLGSELLRNIKNLWWREFINLRADMVGIDSQIMLHPETWVASGHVDSFSDPLVEDLETNKRYRADHIIEGWCKDKMEFFSKKNLSKYGSDWHKLYNESLKSILKREEIQRNTLFDGSIQYSFIIEFYNSFCSGVVIDENMGQAKELIAGELQKYYDGTAGSEKVVEDLIEIKKNLLNTSEISIRLIDYFISFSLVVEDLNTTEMGRFIQENQIMSPDGNPLSDPKEFNQLFETSIGAIAGDKSKVYLRGETAQGIFTNFKQVLNSSRVQMPFGIGQIGKSFRNEVTTGQFVFRTLEFEQGEIEYFFDPAKQDWKELFEEWQRKMMDFVINTLGVSGENVRWRQHTDKERSFYSKETYDIDYHFPFGWKELWGLAYRTDYDLTAQMKHSGESLEYIDPHTQKKVMPHVIEPAVGINRLFLMTLVDAYWKDKENNRTVMKLHPRVAPYKAAVFPLLKNKPELVSKAKDIFNILSRKFPVIWDERGNIGKRYLYQDEIGTPICITVDFESLEDETVTIRHRDTTEQERIKITQLEEYLSNMLN